MRRFTVLLLLLALILTGCSIPSEFSPRGVLPGEDTSTLEIHYIDVGQADCALLSCGGSFMLIDGGNVEDSSLVVSYLQSQGVEELEAVVCSHAHEDHVGGLPGVLAVYPTMAVYAPTSTYSSKCFDDFLYYTDQQGLSVTIPAPGDSFDLGTASVTVLGPVKSYAGTNNTSIVLQVTFGGTAFLFTGDMEKDAEADMLDYWGEQIDWKADILKVGHHGSSTSTSYRFLYEADPDYAVVSCGTGNTYGHPHRETIALLNDAGVPALRTDKLGTILAVSDGKQVTITWENTQVTPEHAEPADTIYIGNVNSMKFHLPTCNGLPAGQNQIIFSSYEEAINVGYTPCTRCLN